jgi:hypothetical protein
MKHTGVPPGTTDWSSVDAAVQPGATGTAASRGRQLGDVQIRMVTYSAGYTADHWCHKGHIATIEHADGRSFELSAGVTYRVADDEHTPHRLSSRDGATVFVLD